MINIVNKKDCCGCSACVQRCPQQCISLYEDEEGFLYPKVEVGACIGCGLCEKVCPVINQYDRRLPLHTYAAVNDNEEIRVKSSSGGVFTLLAEKVIDEGGVVFGARFDENWQVTFDYTETKDGLEVFRGSKYVQARIAATYEQCENFLKSGRKVLYSGTPCQISGLKHFLRREYDNLLAVDIVCHGVPSPLVWRDYLKKLTEDPKRVAGKSAVVSPQTKELEITGISFRDKSAGWKKYRFAVSGIPASKAGQNHSLISSDDVILQEVHSENLFMQVFLKDLCLRPSCSSCPAKSGKGGSDITIADYWGISNHHPLWDDDKGTSLILVNTSHGLEYYQRLDICSEETSYEQALAGNPSMERCVVRTKYADRFWKVFPKKGIIGARDVLDSMKPGYFQRLKNSVYRILMRVIRIIKLICEEVRCMLKS